MTGAQDDPGLAARLREVLELHFDPEGGSPYWLRRARELGWDPRREIRDVDDLARLGPMPEQDLARTPVEEFVPRARLRAAALLPVESGGTTGEPKFAVHAEDEFAAAFVEPFARAAAAVDFPRERNWLYLGPTGPHVIGHAAVACARALGAPAPFMVDLDPRWARKLEPGSFARRRYEEHVADQALRVLERQHVGVIFATPPLLAALAGRMPPEARARIEGIHFGGMAVSDEERFRLRRLFRRARMLSGFGNALLGMAPEVAYEPGRGSDYAPWGTRLVYRVLPGAEGDPAAALGARAAYGERGRLLVHRLDRTQLIVNLLERDTAVRIPAPDLDPGFVLDGIRDPRPLPAARAAAATGLY